MGGVAQGKAGQVQFNEKEVQAQAEEEEEEAAKPKTQEDVMEVTAEKVIAATALQKLAQDIRQNSGVGEDAEAAKSAVKVMEADPRAHTNPIKEIIKEDKAKDAEETDSD